MAAAGKDGETAFAVFTELGEVSVADLDLRDAPQAQFLDQAVLQGLVGAFDATFGLGRIGTDDLDVQFLHRPPKLGEPGPFAKGLRLIDPEDAMFVAVEGHRLAIALKIMPRGFAGGKESLFWYKPEFQELPGGIIDVHQQSAPRPTTFKPIVIRSVDLYQFPKTGPPLAHLVNRWLFGPFEFP